MRRKPAAKRNIIPDPKFGSVLIAKFINFVMGNGKKSVAEKIVYGALDAIEEQKNGRGLKGAAIDLFKEAIESARPRVEVRSRRIGGATYQVPVEVRPDRGEALAMRWIIENAKKRGESTMALKIAGEILDILGRKGGTLKKREDVHKMAEANKAFAHFRWN